MKDDSSGVQTTFLVERGGGIFRGKLKIEAATDVAAGTPLWLWVRREQVRVGIQGKLEARVLKIIGLGSSARSCSS